MLKLLTIVRRFPQRFALLTGLALISLFVTAPAAMAAPSQVQKCANTDVKCVITFGDHVIVERQTALDKLADSVTTMQQKQHISDAQADALHTDIKSNRDGLTDIKTKLDAETSAQAARQDIKNVYEQLRIFAVVLPRDARHLHMDIEVTLADKLRDLEQHLQQVVNNDQDDKKAKMTDLFNDYKAAVADAEGQVDIAQAIFPMLTVANFNANHAAFTTDLHNLSNAEQRIHTDLHKAAADLHQISQLLKSK
ncbi:MAG TPA: hypothetical protein VFU49_12635 [Ktedonobacteraceae bacterium]|nr:hypothetical protein [Ktedonobacteraceae bacterium]